MPKALRGRLGKGYLYRNLGRTKQEVVGKWPAAHAEIEQVLETALEGQSKAQELFEDMAAYLSINLPGYEGNSIAAQSLNLNKKARIVYVQKEIGIEFKLPFDRTWSAISRAIEKTDYEVVDTNRDLKYIQIKASASLSWNH